MKSTAELKFLLTLLSCADYRSLLGASCFSSFKGKAQLCQDLRERGWIDYSQEIASVKLLPAGQALLALDPARLPIDAQALQMLTKLALKPGKVVLKEISMTKLTTSAAKQAVLSPLADRGFVELEWQIQRAKGEVWLTPEGLAYLREDYHPKGLATISLTLLGHYVKFLRTPVSNISDASQAQSLAQPPSLVDDPSMLSIIKALDTEIGTENYLPIFHLRQKLAMPRQEFDQALYRLQRSDQIELSSLQEADNYSPEQIDAGIPQPVGGPLFFISVA